MYKTLTNTGIVMVTVVVMFSIIQVVIPLANKQIKVKEGMSSGSTSSLPTLRKIIPIFLRAGTHPQKLPSDQVILNDMNILESRAEPQMWPINPTHPPTISQNMVHQDVVQKELMDAYYRNEGSGSEFTLKYPCRPTTTGEYEDCGPYGANIPCYSNGKVKDNRMILKDCCKLPAPTAATNGPAGANISCFEAF
jgi:hypothetical protein